LQLIPENLLGLNELSSLRIMTAPLLCITFSSLLPKVTYPVPGEQSE